MIFTRIFSALFATTICAQALYVPNGLYARDFEVSRNVAARELSERGVCHLNAIRDLAQNNDVSVLAARDLATLELRSEDVLSHIIVARTRTPSPGPYECKTKADCQKKIDYAKHQVTGARAAVDRWNRALSAAGNNPAARRTAKNNLDTAKGSLEHWREEVADYTDMKARMRS